MIISDSHTYVLNTGFWECGHGILACAKNKMYSCVILPLVSEVLDASGLHTLDVNLHGKHGPHCLKGLCEGVMTGLWTWCRGMHQRRTEAMTGAAGERC